MKLWETATGTRTRATFLGFKTRKSIKRFLKAIVWPQRWDVERLAGHLNLKSEDEICLPCWPFGISSVSITTASRRSCHFPTLCHLTADETNVLLNGNNISRSFVVARFHSINYFIYSPLTFRLASRLMWCIIRPAPAQSMDAGCTKRG